MHARHSQAAWRHVERHSPTTSSVVSGERFGTCCEVAARFLSARIGPQWWDGAESEVISGAFCENSIQLLGNVSQGLGGCAGRLFRCHFCDDVVVKLTIPKEHQNS